MEQVAYQSVYGPSEMVDLKEYMKGTNQTWLLRKKLTLDQTRFRAYRSRIE